VEEKRNVHTPVLLRPVLDALRGEREPDEVRGRIVDATLGAGGHACEVLTAFPHVTLLGIDQDPEILDHARERLAVFGDRCRIRRGRVSQLEALLEEEETDSSGVLVGLLLDLGVSSLQLDRPERGFSFQADGPLDMRMDPSRARTAADIVNRWDEADLADLFYHEGGERRSRRIAKAVCEARRRAPFLRTAALAETIANAVGARAGGKIHPATKCFQALRRAVNEEGEELIRGLDSAERLLSDGGRLAIISFHEGEDRVVKHFLAEGAREGRWHLPARKPIVADHTEVRGNPRARSAKLRRAVRTRRNGNGGTSRRPGGWS
jgi:16S rRNA (cytosine1402-N4)-methyltransferase